MTALIVTIHVIVSIALILIVLLQTGKGADMGAVFGGAGSQALFGNTGAATFLGKMTTAAAVIFMITSLTLAYISKSGSKSVVSDIKPLTQQTQPAVPVQPQPNQMTKTVSVPGPELSETDQNAAPRAQTQDDVATTIPAESVEESVPVTDENPELETPVTTE
ncbi:MAG: preprotein translocase subunit SecG [Desulfobacteraceae bacterium]|jgi:preprotein translocase subunit SecG|nr:preprotein translocase subunit SecG [Desulfobacteraceae bacterium]